MYPQNATYSTIANSTPHSIPQIQRFHPLFDIDSFKIFMALLYGMIFLIGMPGNILVIMTITRVPKMRSTKNLFIANLAVGDLVNIIWCLPTSLLSLYISWPYGHIVCKYIFPMADVIIGNTIFTMVSIALDRYRAIVHPFTAKPTLRKTILIIVFTWALSYCLMGLPLVIAFSVSQGYWVKMSCNLEWKSRFHELFYRLGTCTLLFCIPFIVVLFCFLRIKQKLEENIRFARESIRGLSTLRRAKKNQKLINMLFVIFSCFTLCFLPINVLLLVITFHREIVLWKYAGIAFQLAIALLFLNSLMNPIILFKLSRDYRIGYYEQLRCFCPNSKKVNEIVGILRRRLSATSTHRISIVSLRSLRQQYGRTSTMLTEPDDPINKPEENDECLNLPPSNDFAVYESAESVSSSLLSKSRLANRKSVTWSKNDIHDSTTTNSDC